MTPLLLTLMLPVQAAGDGGCPPSAARALDRLDQAIVRIEESLDDVSEKSVRKRMRRQVSDAKRAARHVRDEVCHPLPEDPPPPAPVAPPPPTEVVELSAPMGSGLFRGLLAAVRAESFAEGKLSVLESGVGGQCLTTSQAAQVLDQFSFAKDKIAAARKVVPRLVDREKAFKLYDKMSFSKDKKRLKGIIEDVRPNASCWQGP
jgi:hypothetical protein